MVDDGVLSTQFQTSSACCGRAVRFFWEVVYYIRLLDVAQNKNKHQTSRADKPPSTQCACRQRSPSFWWLAAGGPVMPAAAVSLLSARSSLLVACSVTRALRPRLPPKA
jgi:hypothetical protein